MPIKTEVKTNDTVRPDDLLAFKTIVDKPNVYKIFEKSKGDTSDLRLVVFETNGAILVNTNNGQVHIVDIAYCAKNENWVSRAFFVPVSETVTINFQGTRSDTKQTATDPNKLNAS